MPSCWINIVVVDGWLWLLRVGGRQWRMIGLKEKPEIPWMRNMSGSSRNRWGSVAVVIKVGATPVYTVVLSRCHDKLPPTAVLCGPKKTEDILSAEKKIQRIKKSVRHHDGRRRPSAGKPTEYDKNSRRQTARMVVTTCKTVASLRGCPLFLHAPYPITY